MKSPRWNIWFLRNFPKLPSLRTRPSSVFELLRLRKGYEPVASGADRIQGSWLGVRSCWKELQDVRYALAELCINRFLQDSTSAPNGRDLRVGIH